MLSPANKGMNSQACGQDHLASLWSQAEERKPVLAHTRPEPWPAGGLDCFAADREPEAKACAVREGLG